MAQITLVFVLMVHRLQAEIIHIMCIKFRSQKSDDINLPYKYDVYFIYKYNKTC